MNWVWWIDGWIIVVGVLCALSCALLGNFLVLRKMSMMGDAISHAVLPGLAIAFWYTNSRASVPMFIGAAVVGVLTAFFTEWIRGQGKVDEGASMGVVFTALFALGLVMIVQTADSVDLDPGCVLWGAMESAAIDQVTVLGMNVPRTVLTLGPVLLINLLAVLLFYKELKLSSFDPALATTLGISSRLMHYLLMTLVAITAVASFEAVGNILVVAVMIVPPTAAYMLTDRLSVMILLSLVIAAAGAVLGHLAAVLVPSMFGYESVGTAGGIASVLGVLFTLAVLLGPRHGVISRIIHDASMAMRIRTEDALALLYRIEEQAGGGGDVPHHLESALRITAVKRRRLVDMLIRRGMVARRDGRPWLTDAGRDRARDLVRTHRLWETYLEQFAAIRPDHLHLSAERLEHATTPDMQSILQAETGQPQSDPHGREIPPA